MDLQKAIDQAATDKLYPLGVCWNCPRPAKLEGPDGEPLCDPCSKRLGKKIMLEYMIARRKTQRTKQQANEIHHRRRLNKTAKQSRKANRA